MPKSDPVRERIEAFNQARGGGVLVHKAGRGYSLLSERTIAPRPIHLSGLGRLAVDDCRTRPPR